jgi:hypothetical protein
MTAHLQASRVSSSSETTGGTSNPQGGERQMLLCLRTREGLG